MSRGALPALVALLVGVFSPGCGGRDAGGEDPPAVQVASEDVPELRDYGGLGGAFELTDQRGQRFRLEQMRGRVLLLFFGYTYCPDICPVTLSKIGQVYERLGERAERLHTLFISVDPERDTQEKLMEYLDYFAIEATGLTGSGAEIDQVLRQYGGYYERRDSDSAAGYLVDHSTYTYLIDPQGRVRYLFRHTDAPELVAAVIEKLLDEGGG